MKRTLVLIIILALLVAACGKQAPAFRTTPLDPAPATEISLTDQAGNPFQISAQRGKLVVLVFGFTNCPDECPLTLAHIKMALEALGAESQNVQVVMVTTDPVRDTPQALEAYLGAFNPAFIGLLGSEADLSKAWEAYHVEVMHGGETHSSTSYIIDKQGNLRLAFSPETEPDDLAADLKILLAE